MPAGAPKVTLSELDVSAGARAPNGAYVGMALIAPRGPVGQGMLVTSESDLVRIYTPGGTILPAYDTSFYVAIDTLRKTNKLWCSRAAEQPLFGGAYVRTSGAFAAGAPEAGGPAERGFPVVNHYDITTTDGRINPGAMVFTVDSTPGYLTTTNAAYTALATGDVVTVAVTGGALPAPLLTATNYYAIKSPSTNKIQLATSAPNAANGVAIVITTAGTGTFTLSCTGKSLSAVAWTPDLASDTLTVTSANYDLLVTGDQVTAVAASGATLPTGLVALTQYYVIKTSVVNKVQLASSATNAQNGVALDLTSTGSGTLSLQFATTTTTTAGQEKAILFYAADPGVYNNDISITLTNYATAPTKVKEPGCFLVQVYYKGVALPNESFVCSFDPAHKDGNNFSSFIMDVLARSAYIRATVNPLLPANTSVADALTQIPFAGGSDGLAVTDSTMARALGVLNVPSRYPLTFVHDSGWSTPAYQQACIALAETRGSAAAFIAPPYATEATSNAVIDVVSYYQSLGSGSSHAGIFSPHVQVLDRYNNRKLWISPVGAVAGDYADTFDRLAPGQPVGGQFGQLAVVDVLQHWTDAQMDYLYDNNVNPIRFKAGSGIQIWGQKTLQSRPSDLDRLNARMLLMAIQPALKAAYENFLFTRNGVSNDQGTRRDLTTLTDAYMATVKARGGIYNWLTVCNETNNTLLDVQNETVNIWLLVQVAKAVEYIPFVVAVSPLSVSLDISSSLVGSSL